MKTRIPALMFILFCLQLSSGAQTKPVTLSAEAGIYAGYGNGGIVGPGFGIMASKRITASSLISLSVGYINLSATKRPLGGSADRTRLVPVMIGYRKYWSNIYIESRAGLGELGGKYSIGADHAKPSVLAFMYTLGSGYSFRKMDIGLDIQGGAIGISSRSAGYWYNRHQYFSGLKIVYHLLQ